MPNRRGITPPATLPRRLGPDFRRRYDELEAGRADLMRRLAALGDSAQQHQAHSRARKLLGSAFRKASVSQRMSVLQAAAWLIDLLERLSGVL